jgi:hypothetical protein
MTRLFVAIAAFVAATPVIDASAQPRELRSSEGRGVFVIDANRVEWQGRLVKVSADALEVESDSGVRIFKLGEIRRVDADGDGVWDGALKGAVTGALLGLLATASADAGIVPITSNALTFGLIGLAIDGGCSSRHPVYHAPAGSMAETPAVYHGGMQVAMRVRW